MVGLSRTSWHYQLKPDTNEPIRKRLKEMVDERNVEYLRKIHHALRHPQVRSQSVNQAVQVLDVLKANLQNEPI